MRWFFLLLILLNVFYYVWHQQQAPLRAKEVAPVEAYIGAKKEIQLLSESSPVERRAAVKAVSSSSSSVKDQCIYLGGFDRREDAAQLLQRLTALDIGASVRALEMPVGEEYWVYLEPMASRQASLRQLRELQARRIDSYLISEGELANGISIGIFPREDAARKVLERVQGLGYAAKVRVLPRTHQRYWALIDRSSERLVDAELLSTLVKDFSDVKQQQMPCEGIALR